MYTQRSQELSRKAVLGGLPINLETNPWIIFTGSSSSPALRRSAGLAEAPVGPAPVFAKDTMRTAGLELSSPLLQPAWGVCSKELIQLCLRKG